MQPNCVRAILLLVALGWAGSTAFPAEVGRFAVVQNQVTSLKPGAADPVPARPGAPVVLDELEASGPDSAAKMTFGEGAVISIGQNTRFKVTQQAVDKVTGASVSTVDLSLGMLRVFVSRFWSGRPAVEVETPTAVVGIKGSEVAIEVFEDGRTIVTVLSGSAWVRRKGAPEVRRDLAAAEMLELAPGQGLPDEPSPIDDGRLADLWDDTEPDPSQSDDRPSTAGAEAVMSVQLAAYTAALSAAGSTMAMPAAITVPEFVVIDRAPTRPDPGAN